MSLFPQPNLDFTDRDFASLRQRLIELKNSVFPEWTDDDVASWGNVLLEQFAHVGDVLGYYLDNLSLESRISTATQRSSLIALAKMFGEQLLGAAAATTVLRFELDQVPAAAVVIPAGTVVRTQEVTDAVRFQLLADVVFAAGQDPPVADGIGEHSESHVHLFPAAALTDLRIYLDRTPYLDGSVQVSTSPVETYTQVPSFLASGPTDRHFVLQVDQFDRASLRFGNGAAGAPPSGTLRIDYKTGGGPLGKVDAGRLVVVEGAFSDAHGAPVRVRVTNPEASTGAASRETVAGARLRIPESVKALNRSIARTDFEAHAMKVAGVARALMLTSNEDPTIAENSGVLIVIPKGGGVPTPALRNQVLDLITHRYPPPLTFVLVVNEPVYRTFNISVRIALTHVALGPGTGAEIRRRLERHFAITQEDGTPNPKVGFGAALLDSEGQPAGDLAWSTIFDVVRDTPGVRKIGNEDFQMNGLPSDVQLGPREFPILGTVEVRDAEREAFY